jgi:hypothetical protein
VFPLENPSFDRGYERGKAYQRWLQSYLEAIEGHHYVVSYPICNSTWSAQKAEELRKQRIETSGKDTGWKVERVEWPDGEE